MKFMYQLPGNFYAYGPVEANNLREATKKVRKMWEIPNRKSISVWESDGKLPGTPEENGLLTNHWALGPL